MHEVAKSYIKDLERVVLTVQHEPVKYTRATWRRVTKIVLHEALSIGVGTGGWGPVPAQYFAMY